MREPNTETSAGMAGLPNTTPPSSNTMAQTLSFSELTSVPAANAPLALPTLRMNGEPGSNPLHQIRTKLTVCVGTVELSVGELLSAKAQQVLCLDRAIDQPVDVLLEGQVVARGTLVAVDDRFGVRITELPQPLSP